MADARDYDFQIGDLCFRGATSDRFPYVRATAPFRKEQVDQSQRVGDQSLTGWWTRGQLSFHEGAGVKYYEVLQGEEVLNTFHYGEGVDATVPGEVKIGQAIPSFDQLDLDLVENVASPWGDGAYEELLIAYGSPLALGSVPGGGFLSFEAVTAVTGATPTGSMASNVDTVFLVATDGSIYTWQPGSTTVSLAWTHTDDNFESVHFALGRLWATDSASRVYMLDADTTGSKAIADSLGELLLSAGSFTHHRLSFTETPQGPLFATDGTVWLVTVDETGTPTAPTIVGLLPGDVDAMLYHVGLVIFGCSDGIRLATFTNGGLTFGPVFGPRDGFLNFDGIYAEGTDAFLGGFWFVENLQNPGTATPHGGLIQLNLALQQDLTAPWWTISPADGLVGVRRWGPGKVVFRDHGTAGFIGKPGAGSEGYITTGFHRFGTLESKRFYSVNVRFGCVRGELDVAIIEANGDETPLGTVTITEDATSSFQVADEPFDIPGEPRERLALKFTLREPSYPVYFTGYQLKALPVPERQRILRWPLLLHDVLRLRRGAEVGRQGKAYVDLRELEALESSSAVVTYTDHRVKDPETGLAETGSAYIDSIEFQSDTPASKTTNGFGGIAYITLRVLS